MNNNHVNAEDFWQFSLSIYGHSKVQALCLALQDNHHCNVNVFLFCCWLKKMNKKTNLDLISHLSKAIETSDQTLNLHRIKRRKAKDSPVDYEKLKAIELDLEKQQQCILVNYYNGLISKQINDIDPLYTFCLFYSLPENWVDDTFLPILKPTL